MTADVVVTEFMVEGALEPLRAIHSVLYDPDLHRDRDRLLAAVGDARAVIVRNQTRVDAELLDAAPRLEVIGRLGVGLDNIDLDACALRAVVVHPALGANAVAVAEYVIGALFVLVRGTFSATSDVAAGSWPRRSLTGGELAGRTLGLVGFGAIAREVGSRARALGMSLLAYDPYLSAEEIARHGATRADLETLFATADAVSLHVPLTDETRGLVDAAVLAAMRPHAVLVNTARGGIVDEAALVAALRSGEIAGAALDVFTDEPIDATQGRSFAGVPGLVLTPHVAGLTDEAGVRVSELTVTNVLRALGGAA